MKNSIATTKKRISLSILLLGILSCAVIVYAASFDFNPNIDATTFNLSEDVPFEYDLNVTVNESLVFYSSNAQDLGFNSFVLHNGTGVINFTPPNDEVGYYSVTLIAENRSNNFDKVTMTVAFNVSNVNDAPNITQFDPTELNTTLLENSTQSFSINFTDIDIQYGDRTNVSWYLDNVLVSTNESFEYTPDFCDSGAHTLLVVVNDTSNANDTLQWNITVNNTNRIPRLNTSIENRTWPEDTNLTNNLSLLLHFSDEDNLECSGQNQDNITFTTIQNTSVSIVINQTTSNVSFIVPSNFFGVEYLQINATDGSAFVVSNNITLNVTNVNDPPDFNVSNQTLAANARFALQINGTDPDNEIVSGTNNLTFYDNASFFNISETTGVINVTPTSVDVGIHIINITLNDTITITSKIVVFNVTSNDPPGIDQIPKQNATELTFYVVNVTGSDADNDTITYSTNYTRLTVTAINNTAANLSFLPNNDDVGNHTVLVTATDANGAINTTLFNLTVFNVNNPPNLTAIVNQTLRTALAFSLTATAVDQDNDTLTFSDNTSIFTIGSGTGLISFTPTESDIGIHPVNITVSDGEDIDSQLVIFTVNNNTPPVLSAIGNITIAEDTFLSGIANASDGTDDSLTFSANTTLFNLSNINTSSAEFNFTPSATDVGLHWVNITVNDSPLIDSQLFFINVTFVNDSPVFAPPLTNLNASVAVLFTLDLNATDEENDTITFFANATLFNISNTTGLINFTPTLSEVGNYSINFTLSDGNNINSQIINFTVAVQNIRPNITSVTPNETNITIAENGQLQFNVTATDFNNDTLTYSWRSNNTEISTAQAFIYEPGFDTAGFYNFSIIVSDGSLTDTHSWNLTINDTNRPAFFGIINHTSLSNFVAGNASQINLTAEPGNLTLLQIGGNYVTQGNYTSSVIDFQSNTNLSFNELEWKVVEPQGTSTVFFIRTSSDNATFTNFTGNNTVNYTNPNGSSINITEQRYVQYQARLETSNVSATPAVEYVSISYQISDFVGQEDTVYLNYIDLDNFFLDRDGDSLTYNATTVSDVEISIDSEGRVSLTPESNFAGVRTVVFTATDGEFNTTSNNVTLTFLDVPEPSSSSSSTSSSGGGGGGGGSSRIVFVNKTVYVNQSVSIEIIAPGQIEYGLGSEIIVPITVKNNENYVMTGIELTAVSNRTDIEMEFTQPIISTLASNDQTDVELIIQERNVSMSFEVRVTAQVNEPWVNDSVVISIQLNENASSEVEYVRDFIQLNPECLELSEVLEQAVIEINNANYNKAKVLANLALEQCKSLLTTKKINQEQLADISLLDRVVKSPYGLIVGGPILVGILLTFFYLVYNRVKWY